MKCVLIGPTYPFRGGIAHYTTLLCHELRKRHQVTLLSFRRQYPAWLFPGRTDRDPSQQVLAVDCERPLDPLLPWTWRTTARRIEELEPDLVLVQWWVPFWAPIWSVILWHVRRRIAGRVLFISHNVLPHEARRWDRWLARQVLGQGDAVIVHSQQDRQALQTLLPAMDVRVAVHPTYEIFAPQALSPSAARRRLGLKEEQRVLLFFGFVRAYKGVRYLIEAVSLLPDHLDIHLLIVGEFWDDVAPYREQIRASGLEGRVTVIDRYIPNEEVGIYFAAADLVVLPYTEASQSGVAQIAWGAGVPVITTSVGGLPDVIQDGATGLLVPPGDSPALAAAILRYFEEGLSPTFRANIQAQKARFSWERLAALIEELAGGASVGEAVGSQEDKAGDRPGGMSAR
ncbi:MAG: glycosyltransferase [Anaerolineae bacterium]